MLLDISGSEIVYQALSLSRVTGVVAIIRSSVSVPPGTDSTRFKFVILKNYRICLAKLNKDVVGAAIYISSIYSGKAGYVMAC